MYRRKGLFERDPIVSQTVNDNRQTFDKQFVIPLLKVELKPTVTSSFSTHHNYFRDKSGFTP